ncbi:MAG: hypothetical protein JOZ96_03580 [Acidobacteria bacterium]|nr:hypothetical protein [Acidobacteriota bacterium]
MPARILRAACLLLLCGLGAHAQDAKPKAPEANAGIVYGKDHAFAIKAPDGWVLDNQSGVPNGLHAVFYPEGSSWKESKAVMYANGAGKADDDTLEKFVERDVDGFRKHSPGLKVADDEAPPLNGKEKVLVKRFSGDRAGSHEAVAYVEESKVVVIIVLHARTQKDFDDALPAFRKLVSTYRFISDRVTMENK